MEDFRDDGIFESGEGWEFDDVVEKMIPLGLGVVGCTRSSPRGVVALFGGETVRDGLE